MSVFCVRSLGPRSLRAVMLVLTCCFGASAQAAEGIRWQYDLEAAKRSAAQQGKLVLVHVWAPWCGPCKRMDNEVFNQPELAKSLDPYYVPLKINTEQFPAAKKQFGIKAWPTDLVLSPDGQILQRTEGFKKASQYGTELLQIAANFRQPAVASFASNAPPAAGQPPLDFARNPQPVATYNAAPQANQQVPPQAQYASQQPRAPARKDRYADRLDAALTDRSAASPRAVEEGRAAAPPSNPAAPNFGPGQAPVASQEPGTGLPPLGLEGYCAVQLIQNKRWTPGNPQWGVIHRGRLYLFAGPMEKARFFADPDRYAPVASGDDPVLALDHGQRVAGYRKFGVFFDNRIYLFSDAVTQAQFERVPERYAAEAIQAQLEKR